MDPTVQSDQTIPAAGGGDLAHVTQEMYKKNLELAETNKTLSLLRKIDIIVLNAVTDTRQVAQQIADLLSSEANFKSLSLFLLNDPSQLIPLATSNSEANKTVQSLTGYPLLSHEIVMSREDNLIVQAVKSREKKITDSFYTVLTPYHSLEEAGKIQTSTGIVSTIVYPLIVRNEVIGAMVTSLPDNINSFTTYQLDQIDRLAAVVGIALDNTLLYQKIQDANVQLQEVDKLKDEFVLLASHELRTPMTVIKSYVWLLIQGKAGIPTEKQKTYLDRVYASTERLINMVNDMLNISRIESGRVVIECKSMDLNTLIQDVITEMNQKAQELGIHLESKIPPGLPPVFADSEKIKQVLINLIGNSFKFTLKDGYITVGVVPQEGMLAVSVTDTGRGIAAEDIPKLFQKFGMVGGNYLTKQGIQGTGLGLYLSKSIVELHHGKMTVTSPGVGHGTTFTFTLPIVNTPVQVR